jgi:L-seryl-tRNA(Ser) seleniumtransferase
MPAKIAVNDALRNVPSVDSLLRTKTGRRLEPIVGGERLTTLARSVADSLRDEIRENDSASSNNQKFSRVTLLEEGERRLAANYEKETATGIRRVINATGVVLHTNLGRAPLSEAARRALEEVSGYCSLEYDTTTGARGRRGVRAEEMLAQLCSSEAALIVNNCAAAALLVLTAFARDGEALISRGELVEIGGDFRVPDVMAQSGTRMVEVGTTNRTRLSDYADHLSANTRLLMRVHTSNYRIVGFTKAPTTRQLAELAHENGLIFYEDAGSGALIDFLQFGITGEPIIRQCVNDGADVVSFSGDKLLGGPQAGFLAGSAKVIERSRSHPLYRALRADKLRLKAIEATLESYARGTTLSDIPTHRMLALNQSELRNRSEAFVARVRGSRDNDTFKLAIIEGNSAVGGGAAPTSELPTTLIAITSAHKSANEIEASLRASNTPVISRIENDQVVLDLRTVSESEEGELERLLGSLF